MNIIQRFPFREIFFTRYVSFKHRGLEKRKKIEFFRILNANLLRISPNWKTLIVESRYRKERLRGGQVVGSFSTTVSFSRYRCVIMIVLCFQYRVTVSQEMALYKGRKSDSRSCVDFWRCLMMCSSLILGSEETLIASEY